MSVKQALDDKDVQRLASLLLEALGSPKARELRMLMESGDWISVANTTVDPSAYTTFSDFGPDYCAAEMLRKYPGLPTGIDTAKAARQSFWESERRCYLTNQRLYAFVYGTSCPEDDACGDIIRMVRKNVYKIVGRGPRPDWRSHAGFGPGATYADRGKHILLADKLSSIPTTTAECLLHLENAEDWASTLWYDACEGIVSEVPGNRFTTVPKNAKTDRGICIEPSINLFYQKALGQNLKQRLKKIGIDLEKGQDRNGALALAASLNGLHATIDLSSASDTVSLSCVRLLFPSKWFQELNALRSPRTEIDGKQVLLEKFSSMGNGFTFELETVLFLSIALAACELHGRDVEIGKDVLVYGDDIIVPSDVAGTLLSMLSFFGFAVNKRKTFLEGQFRESCGTDAFAGMPVKAFRMDSCPSDFGWWISAANAIRRMAHSVSGSFEKRWLPAWRFCVDQIPLRHRLYGPTRLGDSVIHIPEGGLWRVRKGESFDVKNPKAIPSTLWIRANLVTTEAIPWGHWREDIQLATRIFSVGDYSKGLTGRGCRVTHKIGWVSVS